MSDAVSEAAADDGEQRAAAVAQGAGQAVLPHGVVEREHQVRRRTGEPHLGAQIGRQPCATAFGG